jgi:hypothetical protein
VSNTALLTRPPTVTQPTLTLSTWPSPTPSQSQTQAQSSGALSSTSAAQSSNLCSTSISLEATLDGSQVEGLGNIRLINDDLIDDGTIIAAAREEVPQFLPILSIPQDYASLSAFTQSIQYMGNGSSFYNVAHKLAASECLHIVVLGGSTTCCSSLNNNHPGKCRDGGQGSKDAWPSALEALFNAHSPTCKPSSNVAKHTVINLCQQAVGTNVWVDLVSNWKASKDHPIYLADIIIVETALNDVEELRVSGQVHFGDGDLRIEEETEILIRLLLQLPQRPALVYLGKYLLDMEIYQ